MIRLEGVSKSFDGGRTFPVQEVSFEVGQGETLVLLGSSGSGKTTLLRMINRLIDPTSGKIEIDGVDVLTRSHDDVRRSIGYVIQGIGLFPHLTIRENVEVVPRLLGWDSERRRKRALELLDLVGMDSDEYAERLPTELSGGQRQRVGVARALAAGPTHLLMDEPFGALDSVTRDALQKELIRIRKALDTTIVFVTHDILEATTLGDRIAVMNEGRLEQVGSVDEILQSPETEFVRSLFQTPFERFQRMSGRMQS